MYWFPMEAIWLLDGTDTNQSATQLLFSPQKKKYNLMVNWNIQVLLYLVSVIFITKAERFCDHVPCTQKIISWVWLLKCIPGCFSICYTIPWSLWSKMLVQNAWSGTVQYNNEASNLLVKGRDAVYTWAMSAEQNVFPILPPELSGRLFVYGLKINVAVTYYICIRTTVKMYIETLLLGFPTCILSLLSNIVLHSW